MGVPTDIKLFRDKIDADGRVEYFDDDGGCYVAIGRRAESARLLRGPCLPSPSLNAPYHFRSVKNDGSAGNPNRPAPERW
jgi:hypothetical protein